MSVTRVAFFRPSNTSLGAGALYCYGAAGIGLWWDGPAATLLMQETCGRLSLGTYIERHIVLLPATCVAMLIASFLCCRPQRRWIDLLQSPAHLLGWAIEGLIMYAAMMAAMMLAHVAMRGAGSPQIVQIGSLLVGNALFLCLDFTSRGLRNLVLPHREAQSLGR